MQNEMRDRIAEIIRNTQMNANPLTQVGYAESDALIACGVILPPCKVGDTVYEIIKFCDENIGYEEFYKPTKQTKGD